MARTLIAYFSRADENYYGGSMKYVEIGNTEVAAGKIRELINADLFKIEMKTPYAKDYMTCIEEAKVDKRNNARPKLVSLPESLDDYDTVILGFPNYWGTMPMAVLSFLDAFDFKGKTILPFCTNEGSGMGNSEKDLKKACAGADIRRGLSVNGSSVESSKPQFEKWLALNGLV